MSSLRLRRSLNVLAAIDAVRETHPELQRPLTVTAIHRVLVRERIDIVRLPIKALAYVEGGLGSYAIVLRAGLNPRHERRVLAHEYAHIKLHYQDEHEVVYQHAVCRRGDPTEIEAQLFARLLEVGPEGTPDHPEIRPYVATLDAASLKRKLPAQTELPLPEPMPVFRGAPQSVHFLGNPEDAWPRPRRPLAFPKVKIGRSESHDALRFDWTKEGKPLGYFHLRLGWLWVYDAMRVTGARGSKWELLVCGDRRTQRRRFVIGSERRDYDFAEGEKRSRAPKDLDRQLERARIAAPAAPANRHITRGEPSK